MKVFKLVISGMCVAIGATLIAFALLSESDNDMILFIIGVLAVQQGWALNIEARIDSLEGKKQ